MRTLNLMSIHSTLFPRNCIEVKWIRSKFSPWYHRPRPRLPICSDLSAWARAWYPDSLQIIMRRRKIVKLQNFSKISNTCGFCCCGGDFSESQLTPIVLHGLSGDLQLYNCWECSVNGEICEFQVSERQQGNLQTCSGRIYDVYQSSMALLCTLSRHHIESK